MANRGWQPESTEERGFVTGSLAVAMAKGHMTIGRDIPEPPNNKWVRITSELVEGETEADDTIIWKFEFGNGTTWWLTNHEYSEFCDLRYRQQNAR